MYTYKWKYQITLPCFRRRVDARLFIAGYKGNFIKGFRSDLRRNLKDTRQHVPKLLKPFVTYGDSFARELREAGNKWLRNFDAEERNHVVT